MWNRTQILEQEKNHPENSTFIIFQHQSNSHMHCRHVLDPRAIKNGIRMAGLNITYSLMSFLITKTRIIQKGGFTSLFRGRHFWRKYARWNTRNSRSQKLICLVCDVNQTLFQSLRFSLDEISKLNKSDTEMVYENFHVSGERIFQHSLTSFLMLPVCYIFWLEMPHSSCLLL